MTSYLNMLPVPIDESAAEAPAAFSSATVFFSPLLELWRLTGDKLAKGLLPGPNTPLRDLLRSILPKLAKSPALRAGPVGLALPPTVLQPSGPTLDELPSRCISFPR